MIRVYLDNCCLNRPFDDQRQARIRLESEAIMAIIEQIQSGKLNWISSDAIDIELSYAPDNIKRQRVTWLTNLIHESIHINDFIAKRAKEIVEMGFKTFDALHLACAEYGNANIFLTTDDKLIRRAKILIGKLMIQVKNPVDWIMTQDLEE